MTTRTDQPTTHQRQGRATDARCAACGQGVVEVNMLIDGREIDMRSCSNCERRSWHVGGVPMALGEILACLSAAPTRFRRDLAVG